MAIMDIDFLDQAGFNALVAKIVILVGEKISKVDGMGLSEASFTNIEKIKLSKIADEANKTSVDGAMSTTSENPVQNKIIQAALSVLESNKAPLQNPTFTGAVKVPDLAAGVKDERAVNAKFVMAAIAEAIKEALADFVTIKYEEYGSFGELPIVGEPGVFYLIPHEVSPGIFSHSIHDMYIWFENKYVLVGDTQVDLSAYAKYTDFKPITLDAIEAAFK